MAGDEVPAPAGDVKLARWEQGERRRALALAATAGAVALLIAVTTVLAVALTAVALELRQRDDVLEQLAEVSAQQACLAELEARFLADVGAVVANIGRAAALVQVAADAELLDQVAAGAQPCTVVEASPRQP